MPTAEQFAKFEEFWKTLWNYIYTILAYFGFKGAEERIDEDFSIPGIAKD